MLGCLLLVISGSHAGSGPECGEREEQEIQSRVSGCLASATFQFEDARDAAREVEDVREAACLLVAQAFHCGSMWKECHSGEEVQQLKDMQLEALMVEHREEGVQLCPQVVEYLASGRGVRRREGKCNDGQLASLLRHSQACSQTATTRANTALNNLKKKEEEDVGKEVHAILCSALSRIRTHCLRKLSRCFNQRDVGRMVEGQVGEMRTYLARLAGNRLGSEQLDACDLDIGHQEEIDEVYGEDGTHHFVFLDVADKEVGTHTFTFEPVDETMLNRTLTEVIDMRGGGGEHGEELQDLLWGESELEENSKKSTEEMDPVFSIKSSSTSFSPCLSVFLPLLAARGLN